MAAFEFSGVEQWSTATGALVQTNWNKEPATTAEEIVVGQ
jgi:hypothetical protein